MLFSWSSLIYATETTECSGVVKDSNQDLAAQPLPERSGPRIRTSGRVPHVQIGVKPVKLINMELFRLVFTLPGLEQRPTIVSLAGATGMWLADDVPVVRRKAIVAGREFSHIHSDGSLHTPLPLSRALEVEEKGWGERHPWADRNDGWEGLVMLYSASTRDELNVLLQLITESYNHVTVLNINTPVY